MQVSFIRVLRKTCFFCPPSSPLANCVNQLFRLTTSLYLTQNRHPAPACRHENYVNTLALRHQRLPGADTPQVERVSDSAMRRVYGEIAVSCFLVACRH